MKLIYMILILGFVSLITPQTVAATEGVEVFDIGKGEIILSMSNSASLQNQAQQWLSSSVIRTAGAFRIEPNDGIAIKIPVTSPDRVHGEWIKGTITEIVIFVGTSETYDPTMLVFTKENHTVAVHIRGETLMTFLKENQVYRSDLYLGSNNIDQH